MHMLLMVSDNTIIYIIKATSPKIWYVKQQFGVNPSINAYALTHTLSLPLSLTHTQCATVHMLGRLRNQMIHAKQHKCQHLNFMNIIFYNCSQVTRTTCSTFNLKKGFLFIKIHRTDLNYS